MDKQIAIRKDSKADESSLSIHKESLSKQEPVELDFEYVSYHAPDHTPVHTPIHTSDHNPVQ